MKQKPDLVYCLNNSRRPPKRIIYNNCHLIMGLKYFQLFLGLII